MMIFNIKAVRGLKDKANRKTEREAQKEVKSIIRTLKSDIKKSAKKGVTSFITKIRWVEEYNEVKYYFISKGFRVWETKEDNFYNVHGDRFLHIAW